MKEDLKWWVYSWKREWPCCCRGNFGDMDFFLCHLSNELEKSM